MRWVACFLALAAVAAPAAAQPSVGTQTVSQTAEILTGGSPVSAGPKFCTVESRTPNKTVYDSVRKQHCSFDYSILSIIRRCTGKCDGCPCMLETRNILVKKTVPGQPLMVCALKDAPAGCAPGCTPATAPVAAPTTGSIQMLPPAPGGVPLTSPYPGRQ